MTEDLENQAPDTPRGKPARIATGLGISLLLLAVVYVFGWPWVLLALDNSFPTTPPWLDSLFETSTKPLQRLYESWDWYESYIDKIFG